MAVYKIFPEKDATIYSLYPSMNTGIDEILECNTSVYPGNIVPEVSRVLIQYSDTDISNVITNYVGANPVTIYFRLWTALVEGLSSETVLELHPVSGSWENGTGKYKDSPKTVNGVSWTWREYSGSKAWSTANYDGTTGSYLSDNPGGGTWYTGSAVTQSYQYRTDTDILYDVTSDVLLWNSGSRINNGFILKQSADDEFVNSVEKQVEFKYFSVDTNTIYPPELEFRWEDYSYNTGSSTLSVLNSTNPIISLRNNKGEYSISSVQKFRLNTRPKYPTRTFQTSSINTANYYLPTSSYYAIRDLHTNELVIPFDNTYTKISADSESSFFTVYMNGLQPERYYQILIKTEINGSTLVLEEGSRFKVTSV